MTTSNKPREGIRVIDLSHMVAVPYAGMILADLGSDTVKAEPLGIGEATRRILEHDPLMSIKGMGAHTEQVFQSWAGISEERITDAISSGVLGHQEPDHASNIAPHR